MDLIKNLDLLSVGITIAGIGILGFTVYFNNPRSITNRSFLLFSIISILWGVVNYINYNINSEFFILWSLRLVIFFAVWHVFSLYQLIYVFPKEKSVFSRKYKYILIPITTFISILNLTPLVFSRVSNLAAIGKVSTVEKGPAILLFIGFVLSLIIGSFYLLVKKYRKAKEFDKNKFKFIFIGILITFFLIINFNFILPALFDYNRFIPLGALFIFPFVAFASYAIFRRGLLNIKTVATEILAFILTVVTFLEILFATEISQIVFRSSIFILVLIFGILLIKSVIIEVKQREKIEDLAKNLKKANDDLTYANERQEDLIHFITHQVKGFFTKSKYIFSALLEGDYGRLEGKMEAIAKEGLRSDNDGVAMVQDVLNAASVKSGLMKYSKAILDFKALVLSVILDQEKNAHDKKLSFETNIVGEDFKMSGDEFQLKHVIKNLIDNSIKYTPSGKITVSLSKTDGRILFSVKDTGVGLTKEDKERLFTEGGKGKNSQKINVDSTGFGLFIAKSIIEAHTGKIWAESEGEGRGSEFWVELGVA